RAGVHRGARRARPLPVRDIEIARGRPARQGPARRVSCGRHHRGICVPGALQRGDVGRPGPGQGDHAAVDELWRLGGDRRARGFWPRPERADEAIYELAGPAEAGRHSVVSGFSRTNFGGSERTMEILLFVLVLGTLAVLAAAPAFACPGAAPVPALQLS